MAAPVFSSFGEACREALDGANTALAAYACKWLSEGMSAIRTLLLVKAPACPAMNRVKAVMLQKFSESDSTEV